MSNVLSTQPISNILTNNGAVTGVQYVDASGATITLGLTADQLNGITFTMAEAIELLDDGNFRIVTPEFPVTAPVTLNFGTVAAAITAATTAPVSITTASNVVIPLPLTSTDVTLPGVDLVSPVTIQ